MTPTQHTQTPWVVKGESIESGGKAIASVWAPRRPDETRLEGESWLDMRTRTQPERDAIEAEMLANAFLIGSAPKLLDLLSKVLGCTELNLDDLEPETRRTVSEAGAYLADEFGR